MSPIARDTGRTREQRFRGRIMGVGTSSGLCAVVGMWEISPFGRFTDVFVELPDGSSLLLAPDETIRQYVSSTYRFDATRVVDVHARRTSDGIRLDAGPLQLAASVGTITPLGRLLRIVPRALAVEPRWLVAIDPLVRALVRGAGTAGSAGGGRREYYGVLGAHAVTAMRGSWDHADLGVLASVDPPVRFGFASMPARPQIVDVETIIRDRVGAGD